MKKKPENIKQEDWEAGKQKSMTFSLTMYTHTMKTTLALNFYMAFGCQRRASVPLLRETFSVPRISFTEDVISAAP